MIDKLQGKVNFDSVNWKGESSSRYVLVNYIYYGSTEYHKEEQWLVHGFDLSNRSWRTFALKDITNLVRY